MGEEKYRLVVEGPPNWTSFREFWKMFYDEGAVVVASTYTKVGGVYDFGFRHDPDHPLESLADYCLGCYTNLQPAVAHRHDLQRYIDEYQADGLLINSIKSCNSFSAGQLLILREVEKRTGKPAAFIESDLVDPRYFSAANIKNRLESYFQMIKQKRTCAPSARMSATERRSAMRTFIGIDLGSTTTKAVVLDEHSNVLGRGITNSRSNYDTAARDRQAGGAGRRPLLPVPPGAMSRRNALNGALDDFLGQLERDFRLEQYLEQLGRPGRDLPRRNLEDGRSSATRDGRRRRGARRGVPPAARARRRRLFAPGAKRKSDFFRDIAGAPVPGASARRSPKDGRHALRPPAQRLRPLDHRGREPASTATRSGGTCWPRSSALHRAARDARSQARADRRRRSQGILDTDDGGDLRRRHRLRPRAAAVLQGARPLARSSATASART